MHLSCDSKKFHDNESTHILHNFWTSTHRREASPSFPLAAPLVPEVAMPYSDMWQDYQMTFPQTRPSRAIGRSTPPDPSWKRPPGRPRARWTDQLHRDNNNVPTATLWRQATGSGHSRATLRSEPTTRQRRRRLGRSAALPPACRDRNPSPSSLAISSRIYLIQSTPWVWLWWVSNSTILVVLALVSSGSGSGAFARKRTINNAAVRPSVCLSVTWPWLKTVHVHREAEKRNQFSFVCIFFNAWPVDCGCSVVLAIVFTV